MHPKLCVNCGFYGHFSYEGCSGVQICTKCGDNKHTQNECTSKTAICLYCKDSKDVNSNHACTNYLICKKYQYEFGEINKTFINAIYETASSLKEPPPSIKIPINGRLHSAAYNIKSHLTANSNNSNLNSKLEILESEFNKIKTRTTLLESKVEIVEKKVEYLENTIGEINERSSKQLKISEDSDKNICHILQLMTADKATTTQKTASSQISLTNGPIQPFRTMETN